MSPELTESRVRELAREEIRAAAKPVASKPVAGEWARGNFRNSLRRANGEIVAEARSEGFSVYPQWNSSAGAHNGTAADLASAMLAADAWARDNAHLLDWTLPPAPVQPVAPRELTIDSRSGAVWNPGNPLHSVECWEGSHGTCPSTMRAPDRSLVACACSCHGGRPPAVPQPAPNDNGDTSLAYACGAVAAAAVAIVDPTQPSDMVFRVVRDALAANGATHPAPDSWHDAVTWIEGWGTEQPAPSATVDEVIDAVRYNGRGMVVTDRLRAALSTLSPAQLRGMVDAIGGGK